MNYGIYGQTPKIGTLEDQLRKCSYHGYGPQQKLPFFKMAAVFQNGCQIVYEKPDMTQDQV